jgi:hypothetical protein
MLILLLLIGSMEYGVCYNGNSIDLDHYAGGVMQENLLWWIFTITIMPVYRTVTKQF